MKEDIQHLKEDNDPISALFAAKILSLNLEYTSLF